jgi:EAL and modified HD-GYP domain-containing signal transduction protein
MNRPAAKSPAPPIAEGIYLARQSILDRNQDLHAFELLFRSGDTNAARFTDGTMATATVMRHVLNEFGLDAVLGKYRGFINLDETMIMSDLIELLPRNRVVLEVLETVELTDRIVKRLTDLKAQGFSLALDDVVGLPPALERVLSSIDIVKVDIQQLPMDAVAQMADKLKLRGVRLLAEKVDDRSQVQACLDAGFELFQGYYFAKPQIIAGKRLAPAEVTIMRLLGLLVGDAPTDEIETLLKQEPGLTMNLLRLTNSVGAGARNRVSSVASALLVLGRRQLLRWLQLLLYSAHSGSSQLPTALMQLAATRGRFMELLAGAWHDNALSDRAFMTGIMSLMDTLLSTSIADILGQVPVADDVKHALLHRKGRLGGLLDVVEAVEARNPQAMDALLASLPGLSVAAVEQAHLTALAWANSIGR